MKKTEFIGKKYGRLTILSFSHSHQRNGNYYWNTKCDCGNLSVTSSYLMKNGKSLSCG